MTHWQAACTWHASPAPAAVPTTHISGCLGVAHVPDSQLALQRCHKLIQVGRTLRASRQQACQQRCTTLMIEYLSAVQTKAARSQ